jgi:hypothetical protein
MTPLSPSQSFLEQFNPNSVRVCRLNLGSSHQVPVCGEEGQTGSAPGSLRACICSLMNYEEAVFILDTSISCGDSQEGSLAKFQRIVTWLAMIRRKAHQTPEYSEEAIYEAIEKGSNHSCFI